MASGFLSEPLLWCMVLPLNGTGLLGKEAERSGCPQRKAQRQAEALQVTSLTFHEENSKAALKYYDIIMLKLSGSIWREGMA